MEWMRMIGFCLLAAVLVTLMRQMSPVYSGLICAVCGVMLLSAILPPIRSYLEMMRKLLENLESDGAYFAVMAKTLGIVLITQTGAEICRELEAPAVAQKVEFCGRIALLSIAVPVLTELTEMSIEVLR